MTERLKLSLTGMWLIASFAAVILPVFLPSYPGGEIAGNPIALATVSMFLLSLPSCLIAIPLAYFINAALGITSTGIGMMYLNVLTLFVLGVVQWFWLVPRVFRGEPVVEKLELSESAVDMSLPEVKNMPMHDDDGTTPLERVLAQEDRR